MSAAEFIKLLDGAVFSDSEEERKAAASALKMRREELRENLKKCGITPESKN